MPNNTLLMIGIGLAAFTLFRREDTDVGEEDLVNRSMMASGTGDTGKALAVIPTINAGNPIGGETQQVQPMADQFGWLRDLFSNFVVQEDNGDTEKLNGPTGQAEVTLTPFVQTPTYIRTEGDQAGEALRQIGIITHPGDVDLINPKIHVVEITTDDYSFGTLTRQEDVQIVAGGANPGDPYFTNLDVLAAFRDVGGFASPTWEREIGPNVFDPEAAAQAQIIMAGPKRNILIDSDAQSPVVVAPTGYDTGLDWI